MFHFVFHNENDKWEYLKKNYEINVLGSEVEILKSKKDEPYLIIPDCVTKIGDNCFSLNTRLREIYIPSSVKSIGKYAFEKCESLKYVYIGENVEHIDSWAFSSSNYAKRIFEIINKSKVKDDGISPLKENCFVYLEDEKDERDIINIDGYKVGFTDDSCLVLDVPKSAVEDGLFEFNGIEYNGKKLENLVLLDCDTLRSDCTSCIINDCANVKKLMGCFAKSNLRRIILPNTLEELSSETFTCCSFLEYVKLPNSLKVIGDKAFLECQELTFTEMPNKLEVIGDSSFCTVSKNGITITMPNTVKKIGYCAFIPECCDALLEVKYLGTKDEWLKIDKDKCWFSIYGASEATIICSDGILKERKGKVIRNGF